MPDWSSPDADPLSDIGEYAAAARARHRDDPGWSGLTAALKHQLAAGRREQRVNPDCASRDRPHAPHELLGPGGNKPGSRCGGVPEPEPALVMPLGWWGDDG